MFVLIIVSSFNTSMIHTIIFFAALHVEMSKPWQREKIFLTDWLLEFRGVILWWASLIRSLKKSILTTLSPGWWRFARRVTFMWFFFSSQLFICFTLMVRSWAVMPCEKVSSFTCTGAVEGIRSTPFQINHMHIAEGESIFSSNIWWLAKYWFSTYQLLIFASPAILAAHRESVCQSLTCTNEDLPFHWATPTWNPSHPLTWWHLHDAWSPYSLLRHL